MKEDNDRMALVLYIIGAVLIMIIWIASVIINKGIRL